MTLLARTGRDLTDLALILEVQIVSSRRIYVAVFRYISQSSELSELDRTTS
jgi:hypothetical protein